MSNETETALLDLFHEYRAAERAYRVKMTETDRLVRNAAYDDVPDATVTLARMEEDAQARVMENVRDRLSDALRRQDVANSTAEVR